MDVSLNLELHSKELLLYPILQNITEGIIISDPSLNIIFFNSAAEKIFQIKADEVLGKHVDDLKPSLHFRSLLNSRQHLVHSQEFIYGDQVTITRGLLELAPDVFACYAILQTADSLDDFQLNSLLQSPYEGITVFDENLRLVYANPACFHFFDCNSLSALSEQLNAFIPRTSLTDSMFSGKPLAGETISVKGSLFELIFLPMVRFGRTVGIIAKTVPASLKERTWGEMVEEYHSGTGKYYFSNIVGDNTAIMGQKELASRAARTISTVLITGESGTGKEIFAHSIHNMSPRRKGPFIKVNCAAVPETLLESELFGYAEGAFTGARKEGKPGKFELANHGTIFLDEIGDMSLAMQAKLLRVLQEKEVERVGGIHTTQVNVRVIAASNQDLLKLVEESKFREDLYYRLNVIILNLPPLRERQDDIPLIANALLQRLNQQLGTRIVHISNEAMDCFLHYNWPGNIRELENTLERAMNFCDGNTIDIEHIPEPIVGFSRSRHSILPAGTLEHVLQEREKEVILSTLRTFGGNKTKAARALNIHRSALYRKMNKYQIDSL